MLANFTALGILASIHANEAPAGDFAPFRVPMTCLGGVLGICALGLVAVAFRVQVVQADALAVRPHLGIQADGGRRFEYNPRMIDLVRTIPRGTIYDRTGLPLATGRRCSDCSGPAEVRASRRGGRDRLCESGSALLPAWSACLSRARRCAIARELDGVEHLVRREGCQRSAPGIRRSRGHAADDERGRAADVHDRARLPRPRARAPPSVRTRAPGNARLALGRPRCATHARRAACKRDSPPSSRTTRVARRAGPPRS